MRLSCRDCALCILRLRRDELLDEWPDAWLNEPPWVDGSSSYSRVLRRRVTVETNAKMRTTARRLKIRT